MRAFVSVLALLSAPLPLRAQLPVNHTLMPVPASVTLTPARLRLDSSVTVALAKYRDPRLERAVTRAIARLEMRVGVPLSRQYGNDRGASIVIDVAAQGFAVPDLAEDESYQLNVTATQAKPV